MDNEKLCPKCGQKTDGENTFCPGCGARLDGKKPAQCDASAHGSGNIKLCADGKYRWVYEYSMLKNPTILFTVFKILAICACAPALITLLSSIGREGAGAFLVGVKVYGIALLIALPLTLIAYIILAAIYGWKYIVLFEMDDGGIVHIQQDKQFKKAQGIAWLTILAGVAAKSTGRVGQGVLVSGKNSQSSDFAAVKSVVGIRRRDTIKLNQPFAHNQIYVEKEDYDFVWEYITSRCTKAKIR